MTRNGLLWVSVSMVVLLLPVSVRTQWETPNRAFHKDTGFALDGRHLTVPCQSCHLNGVFKGTPTACADCHWLRRRDDRYETRLGMQCEQCHRTTAWLPARWDHAAQANVPLSPVHRMLACESCHVGRTFQGASASCVSCHLKDYQATTRPNHMAAGFPTNCETCHRPSDTSFDQATFDHNATFPLVGVHATQACQSCHRNNVYKGTPRDCVGCHRADYDHTQNPNHAAAGFPTTCDSCHRPTDPGWTSGTGFNHNSVFPLVGVHATQACAACHRNNVYKGTPRDCVGCHRTDYDHTQNPNHAAAGFPTSCDSCHRATDTSWSQGRFVHSWFPITSGKHAGQPCSACHTNPSSYAVFTCTTCHGRSETDQHHREVSGYRYDSAACYACHPTGRGER